MAGQLLHPDALLLVSRSIPEPLDRWQCAAGLTLAGGFGTAWKAHLEPFWAEEMQRLRPGSTDRATGPLRLAADLKAAAARSGLPLRKNAKEAKILAALPQTVPLDLVAEAQPQLRRRRAETALAAALAARGLAPPPGDALCARFLASGRPSLNKVVATLGRRAELEAALAARGLDSHLVGDELCDAYIKRGEGGLQAIVDTLHEMDFVVEHAAYEELREEEWARAKKELGWVGEDDEPEVTGNARAAAWYDLVRTHGKEALLAMEDLPPSFRDRLTQGWARLNEHNWLDCSIEPCSRCRGAADEDLRTRGYTGEGMKAHMREAHGQSE